MEAATIAALLKLAISLALIAKGADWFTEAAVHIARASRVPQVVIGATIVSFTTTMPEFTVSTYSVITTRGDYAIGNAIGSTMCNIGLILGTCLVIRPMRIDRSSLTMQQGLIMIGVGVLVTLLGMDGRLSRMDAVLLLFALAGYVYYSIRTAERERDKALSEFKGSEIKGDVKVRRAILLFFVGAACVILGSRWLVNSAELIARTLGVPDLIVGVTLVALGTSFPEYVTGLTATLKGYQEISVGNIMGADILDIVWVLGASALLRPLPIQRQTNVLDFPFMLVLMVMLTVFARTRNEITRREGVGFFVVYSVYLVLMFAKFRS